MHGYSVGLCSYSMYIYAFIWASKPGLSPSMLTHLKDYLQWDYLHRELGHFEPFKHRNQRGVGGWWRGLVSESKSTHDKLLRYASSISKLNRAMLFTYKLCPCQSVGGYLFVRINIGIFYSVYLQVLPSQWVGGYLFVQNQYFVTSSPAKQSSCHRREKTLCNSARSVANWTDELL